MQVSVHLGSFLNEYFDILENTSTAKSYMRGLTPLSCLYSKYSAGARTRLAQLSLAQRLEAGGNS